MRLGVRYLKFMLTFISAIALFFLIIIGVVSLVDWNNHRDSIARIIERNTEYKVEKWDTLELHLSFLPSLTLENFVLHSKTQNAVMPLFSIGKLHIQMAILPLVFRHELHVTTLDWQDSHIKLDLTSPREMGGHEKKVQGRRWVILPFLDHGNLKDIRIDIKYGHHMAVLPAIIHVFKVDAPQSDAKIDWHGRVMFGNVDLAMRGHCGSYSQFSNREEKFPFDGEMIALNDKLAWHGSVQHTDKVMWQLSAEAHGTQLKTFAAMFGVVWSVVPAYSAGVVLDGSADDLVFNRISVQIGNSSLNGTARIMTGKERPSISLTATMDRLHADDFTFVTGGPTQVEQAPSSIKLPLGILREIDASVLINIHAITGTALEEIIGSCTMHSRLHNGKLTIDPLVVGVSGGSVRGRITIDGSRQPYEAQTKLGFRDVEVSNLASFGERRSTKNWVQRLIRGKLVGEMELTTSGDSLSTCTGHLNGSIRLAIEDGEVASTLVHALGIDIPKTIGSLLAGNRLSKIECLVAVLKVDKGVLNNQIAILATKEANIFVTGKTDLKSESVDYTIEERAKDFSIGSTQSPISIKGPWQKISVSLMNEKLASRLGTAALAAAVNPVLALVPFVDLGLADQGRCMQYRQTLREIELRSKPR